MFYDALLNICLSNHSRPGKSTCQLPLTRWCSGKTIVNSLEWILYFFPTFPISPESKTGKYTCIDIFPTLCRCFSFCTFPLFEIEELVNVYLYENTWMEYGSYTWSDSLEYFQIKFNLFSVQVIHSGAENSTSLLAFSSTF